VPVEIGAQLGPGEAHEVLGGRERGRELRRARVDDGHLEAGGHEASGHVDERGRELGREDDLGGHGSLLWLVGV